LFKDNLFLFYDINRYATILYSEAFDDDRIWFIGGMDLGVKALFYSSNSILLYHSHLDLEKSYPDNIFLRQIASQTHVKGELFDELDHVERCCLKEGFCSGGKLVIDLLLG